MSPVRWVIFITALVSFGWLHFMLIEPRPARPAVWSSVKQLHLIGDDLIAVYTTGGRLYLWSFSNLSDPRVMSAGTDAVAWPQDKNTVAFYRQHKLKVYDLEASVEALSVELRSNTATIASYSRSTEEVIAQTHLGLQAFDASELAEADEFRIDSRLLYPHTSPRRSSRQLPTPDLSLLPGPSGAFVFYDNTNGELWRYFPGPDANLEKVDDLTEEPDILWANNGGSFTYRPSGESRVHVVNRTHHYDWPAPGPGPNGTPWIEQLTTHAVILVDGHRVHFYDIANGRRIRTIEYESLHSLPPLDGSAGESSHKCRPAVSDNVQFLMLNCEFRKVGTTSITNLSTLKIAHFRRYDTIPEETAKLSVSNTGASVLGHANMVQFVAAGSTEPNVLVGPSIPDKSDSQLLWWIYRGFVLMVALSMAVSMNNFNNQLQSENYDSNEAAIGVGLFFAIKSMFIVIIPTVLFYVWFAQRVIAGKEPYFGGMHPGISLVILGFALIVALGGIGAVAALAAAVGSIIARRCGAKPANAALVSPIFVYAGLLGVSFWF